MKSHQYTIKTNNEIVLTSIDVDIVSNTLISLFKDYNLICLHGNLGAGKTYLTQKILKLLGVREYVTSPTFTIMNQYKTKNYEIFHIDAYRINDREFQEFIDIDEILNISNSLTFIEWPKNINKLLNRQKIDVFISLV